MEYLTRDFSGMFERADLAIVDGAVYNHRFGVQHPHEFPKPMSESLLEELYPSAKEKHDRWCATSRQVLDNHQSTLFILAEPIDVDIFTEISAILERRCSKPILLLQAPEGDDDVRLHWEGSPELWDRHLAPFAIEQTLTTRASNLIFRAKKNAQYLVPKRLIAAIGG